MAKKNKRNIKALIAKRAELQSLTQQSALAIPGAPKSPRKPTPEFTPVPDSDSTNVSDHHGKEIWRTLFATGLVTLVLVAVIVIDRQNPFLDTFGATLYDTLRLGS